MIILRQKEYTSLSRKIGAKIGRLRVNAANHMYKRAKINEVSSQRQANKLIIQNKLKSQADLDNNPDCGYRFGEYLKGIFEDKTKVPVVYGSDFHLAKNNKIMVVDPSSKAYGPSIAHEIGHYYINTGKTGDRKIERDKLKFDEVSEKYKGILDTRSANVKLKDIPTIRKWTKYNLRNENNASKVGKSIMSGLGANKNEMKFANNYLKEAGKTYKFGNKARKYMGLGNLLNIKSRLKDKITYDSFGLENRIPVNMTKFELERNKARNIRRNKR